MELLTYHQKLKNETWTKIEISIPNWFVTIRKTNPAWLINDVIKKSNKKEKQSGLIHPAIGKNKNKVTSSRIVSK